MISSKRRNLIKGQKMKKFLLIGACIHCLSISQTYGMEQPDLPEHTKICALASLAVYGDEHEGSKEARVILESTNHRCDETYENPSVGLKMQLWRHLNGQAIIAIRGTITSVENILSDAAIIKYGIEVPAPLQYISTFVAEKTIYWQKNKFINNPIDDYLPTASTFHYMIDKISATLGGVAGAGVGTLALGTVGILGLSGAVAYAAYKWGGNYHPETLAINAMVASSQAALKKTNEWMKICENLPYITGHSLGGRLVNTITELSEILPAQSITFNAPGGAGRFINAQKKYILGMQDNNWSWMPNPFVRSEEEISHDFRCITLNIGRENEIVSCFGGEDASRKSILIKDYYNKEKCPMSFLEYTVENHAIYNLAKDLGAL